MINRFRQSFKLAANATSADPAAVQKRTAGLEGPAGAQKRSVEQIGSIATDLALALTAAEWERIKDSGDVARLLRFASYFPGYYGELAYERAGLIEHERREYARWYWANEQNHGLAYIREFTGSHDKNQSGRTPIAQGATVPLDALVAEAGPSAAPSSDAVLDSLIQTARARMPDPPIKEGLVFRDTPLAPELVAIPCGSFVMGADDEDARPFEQPTRKVTITQPIAVGRYPVTFDEWFQAVASGAVAYLPDDEGWGRGRRPIINVSWHDAKKYIAWLSKVTGYAYRLLTEAEWEYCCRAGSTASYAMGPEILPSEALFSTTEWGSAGQTCEVGNFGANAFGLHDLHGNVAEWVEDDWINSYGAAGMDGSAVVCENPTAKITRGGGWPDLARSLGCASRNRLNPNIRNNSTGFRVARTLST